AALRATEEGEVTAPVVAWYRRFAGGEPGAIVLEATGIRDVPSGPLLRDGDDRFIPGLARVARAVAEASGGRTRLLVQIIDFLRIRRRPEPARYFAASLGVGERHGGRLVAAGHEALAAADEPALRAGLAALPESVWEVVVDPRELESLTMGERERVTDVHLPHVRDLPDT